MSDTDHDAVAAVHFQLDTDVDVNEVADGRGGASTVPQSYWRNVRSLQVHSYGGESNRLTLREMHSSIQPGSGANGKQLSERFNSMKAIAFPKIIEFFLGLECRLMVFIVVISTGLTALVIYCFPVSWQVRLEASSPAVKVLGSFLSFALVFRTQSCYMRWWEARCAWECISAALINISGQASCWFGDDALFTDFIVHCAIFPYACKALLRGNLLTDPQEEGRSLITRGLVTSHDLVAITEHGLPPFVCLDIMRRIFCDGLRIENGCLLPPTTLNGALGAMEKTISDLSQRFGDCLRIKDTRMPASYTIFMRSFIVFYFVLVSLVWAPTIKWFTPIVSAFVMFLTNTVIVIGNQMMRPFDLQWGALPLKKYCVGVEHEMICLSKRRHSGINSSHGSGFNGSK